MTARPCGIPLFQLLGEIAEHEDFALLRRRLGLSQHEVTIGTGVPPVQISQYETGAKPIPEPHKQALLAYYQAQMVGRDREASEDARGPGPATV